MLMVAVYALQSLLVPTLIVGDVQADASSRIDETTETVPEDNNHNFADHRQLLGLRGGSGGMDLSSAILQQHDNTATAATPDYHIPSSNITIPVHEHSGTHHVHLYIGSPPQRQTLIVDTGSKAMAFPCKSTTSCKKCDQGRPPCCGVHASPYYDPSLSTTYRVTKCSGGFGGGSSSCLLAGISACSLFGDFCTFSQKYTEGSSWTATEVEDIVWLGSSDVAESLELYMAEYAVAYPFGCQTNSKGLFRKQYADGILGLSIHETSIVNYLYSRCLLLLLLLFCCCISSS